MNKLIVPFIAALFTFGSLSTFAAETVKKEELTQQERADMRARAEKLKEERANAPQQEKVRKATHKAKHSAVHHARHGKHVAKHVKKSHHHA